MLTDKRLDGMSKTHLLSLEFPKLPSPVHSSGRKLIAAHLCIFMVFFYHEHVEVGKQWENR